MGTVSEGVVQHVTSKDRALTSGTVSVCKTTSRMTYFVKLLCVTIPLQYTLTGRIIDEQYFFFFTKSTEKNRTLISISHDRLLNWAFIPSG